MILGTNLWPRHGRLSIALLALVFVGPLSSLVSSRVVRAADTAEVLRELEKAKRELTDQPVLLRYKFQAGQAIPYQIEQLVTIDTTIAGNNQKTQLTTRSGRTIRVENVEADGTAKFTHVIDFIELWSEVTGREAVRYDSRKDAEPPAEYETMASYIGKPLSVITMDARGTIVQRQDQINQPEIGLGGLSIPLPEQPIAPGTTWNQPLDVRVRTEDQQVKTIKTRELYRLERVETGVATISIRTEILTPLDDPRIKSQLIQRISQGEIKFDIEAGRMLSKQLDWDEKVVGFAGADSNMKYLARFTERLEAQVTTAQVPTPVAQ